MMLWMDVFYFSCHARPVQKYDDDVLLDVMISTAYCRRHILRKAGCSAPHLENENDPNNHKQQQYTNDRNDTTRSWYRCIRRVFILPITKSPKDNRDIYLNWEKELILGCCIHQSDTKNDVSTSHKPLPPL
jgi:hypothetical protein